MTYCRYCLFDIIPAADGRWRLAWTDADADLFACDGSTGHHEPAS